MARPRPQVAVSVRQWNHFPSVSAEKGMARYRESFASLVTHLVQCYDAEVTFISTCQGAVGYHDDSQVAAAIAASLPKGVRGSVHVNGEFHTPDELRGLLRGFDCVVSTRMHLAILALGVGTPVLPIAYEFKTTELCRMLGYAEPPLRVDKLSPDKLIAGYERFVQSYSAVAEHIDRAVDRFRHDARNVSKLLANCLRQRVANVANPDQPTSPSEPANQQVAPVETAAR